MTEFHWICDEAYRVTKQEGILPPTLLAMFGENAEIASLQTAAEQATSSPSPYVR